MPRETDVKMKAKALAYLGISESGQVISDRSYSTMKVLIMISCMISAL
jgi:hypothetical protein